MTESKEIRIREWINTTVAIIGMFILLFATIYGAVKLNEINVNLKEINADKATIGALKTNKITSNCPNGTEQTGITFDSYNGVYLQCGNRSNSS